MEFTQHQFCHILLAKATHKASPDSREWILPLDERNSKGTLQRSSHQRFVGRRGYSAGVEGMLSMHMSGAQSPVPPLKKNRFVAEKQCVMPPEE